MAKCDLCGKTCVASEMVLLRDEYQVADVKDICPKCGTWADNLKSDLLLGIASKMRAAIEERARQARTK